MKILFLDVDGVLTIDDGSGSLDPAKLAALSGIVERVQAAGDPDAAASIASATHVAASLASAAHAAAALGGPTKAAPSSASPAEPRPLTASPDSHVARRPRPTATRRREWERTGNAALLAAALAEPTKEWLAPVLDSPAVAPVAVAADAAMDTATGGQP